jgi:hypothetical protein
MDYEVSVVFHLGEGPHKAVDPIENDFRHDLAVVFPLVNGDQAADGGDTIVWAKLVRENETEELRRQGESCKNSLHREFNVGPQDGNTSDRGVLPRRKAVLRLQKAR